MLDPKKRYLQIALNSTLAEARQIIFSLPASDRILIEAGTPLIKRYGEEGIAKIRQWYSQRIGGFAQSSVPVQTQQYYRAQFGGQQKGLIGVFKEIAEAMEKQKKGFPVQSPLLQKKSEPTVPLAEETPTSFDPYIVADLKCMDRGATEVEIAKRGGADAAVALGHAPIETLDAFIENCEKIGLDSMIDMMNVDFPLTTLRQLKKLPHVVVLHRGVDEEKYNREKEIPFHEITRIKSNYDILIAVAGGDTPKEVQSASFNDADIVVVWKSFYTAANNTAEIAEEFLKEIR